LFEDFRSRDLINLFWSRTEIFALSSEVQSLEVSYFLQATEDEGKVRQAVRGLIGVEVSQERQLLEGHYGNAIVWVRCHPTGEEAKKALLEIFSHMREDVKRSVLADLGPSLDEHNALYIRLSKQVLVMQGNAVPADSVPIRVKVKPRSFLVKGDPVGFYTRLLGKSA
jgi:RNA binding exosome subunit